MYSYSNENKNLVWLHVKYWSTKERPTQSSPIYPILVPVCCVVEWLEDDDLGLPGSVVVNFHFLQKSVNPNISDTTMLPSFGS